MSNAVVVYATRYGSTRTVAGSIQTSLREVGIDTVDIMSAGEIDQKLLDRADLVVIGGPIYAGRILGDIPKFCEAYREQLLQRPVGLFITCLYDGEQASTQLVDAYPSWLHGHACISVDLGGRVKLQSLKFIDRFLMHNIAKVRQDVDRIRMPAVRSFAADLAGCIGSGVTSDVAR